MRFFAKLSKFHAGVAKLADAPDLGSGAERRGGSSPFTRTSVMSQDMLLNEPPVSLLGVRYFWPVFSIRFNLVMAQNLACEFVCNADNFLVD